jgi:thiol:disulfide interchange protein DsbA
MKRRDFHGMVAIGLGTVGTSALAQAGAPVEGVHYLRLSKPAPVSAPTGKIEVVEFFWYGCPHCNALEPALEAWARKLPADVAFRRVPVAFSATHESHQKLFYALEAMGALEAMHPRVFAAIHNQRQRLDRDADQAAFVRANGLDADKFLQAGKSFTVQTRMRQAKQLAQAYDVDGVPTLGVHGRFYTGGALAGDNVRALAVAEVLIDRVRRNA